MTGLAMACIITRDGIVIQDEIITRDGIITRNEITTRDGIVTRDVIVTQDVAWIIPQEMEVLVM